MAEQHTSTPRCDGVIRLDSQIRSERRRSFQPPWYTVYIYRCPKCARERAIRANAYRGRNPEPGIGGIRCAS